MPIKYSKKEQEARDFIKSQNEKRRTKLFKSKVKPVVKPATKVSKVKVQKTSKK